MLSSLSKLRIFLFNAHLALIVRKMTQLQSLNSTGKYRHLYIDLEIVRAPPSPLADQTTSRIGAELGKNVNVRFEERFAISVRGGGLCKL